MNLTTTIFKRKSGRHRGKWVLQIAYHDTIEDRERVAARMFATRSDAVDERPKLEAKLHKTHGRYQTGKKTTFRGFCETAKATFYKAAVIKQGRRTDGVRSWKTTHGQIDRLAEFFGDKKLTQITPEDLIRFKNWRLDQGSRRGLQEGKVEISFTTVNRELMTLRHILKKALSQGLMDRDVFMGSDAIDRAAERPRSRTLSDAEEDILLACCGGKRQIAYKWKRLGIQRDVVAEIERNNPELRAIIVLAVDSALRRGELLKLRWQDVDFDARVIRVVSTNTKTQHERLTLLSKRAAEELRRLSSFGASGKIFSIDDFKRSWVTAKRLAGIDGLTFHDLRRTSITRMVQCGAPIEIARKIAGHAPTDVTSKHYVAADAGTIRWLADLIDERNEGRTSKNHSVNLRNDNDNVIITQAEMVN